MNSDPESSPPPVVVYEDRASARIVAGAFTGVFSALAAACLGAMAFFSYGPYAAPRNPVLAWVVFAVFFAAMASFSAYYAGPNRITFDFANRTYSFKRGFPLLAQTGNGSFDEISELFVKKVSGRAGTFWYMMAAWKQPERSPFCILIASNMPHAVEQMRSLGGRLGVKVDDAPRR